jgi:hypothetical protein
MILILTLTISTLIILSTYRSWKIIWNTLILCHFTVAKTCILFLVHTEMDPLQMTSTPRVNIIMIAVLRASYINCQWKFMKTAVSRAWIYLHLFYDVSTASLSVMDMTGPNLTVHNHNPLIRSVSQSPKPRFLSATRLSTMMKNITPRTELNNMPSFLMTSNIFRDHMNFRDIGMPKHERTQAFRDCFTPRTTRSQDTHHHNHWAVPPLNCHSTCETAPKSKNFIKEGPLLSSWHPFPHRPISPPVIQ